MRGASLLRATAVSAGVAFMASCGGDDERAESPSPADSPTVEVSSPGPSVPTPSAPPIETGMAETIRAVESGEEVQILERTVLSQVPCSSNWPQPPCPAGQPEGTRLPRLPFLGCEPAYLTPDDVRVVIGQVIAGRMPALFAAASVSGPGAAGAFPLGPYALIFRTTPPLGVSADSAVLAVLDQEGHIVSMRTGCRATPQELLQDLPGAEQIESPRGVP